MKHSKATTTRRCGCLRKYETKINNFIRNLKFAGRLGCLQEQVFLVATGYLVNIAGAFDVSIQKEKTGL